MPTLSRCNWSAQHAKEAVGWASPGSSHGTIFLRQNQGDISPPGQFFFIWTLKGGYWFPTIKAIQAAITLGTGCSLGPEGPSVDIGKSCANGCAEMMENNRERRIALVAAGSAAGIASGILINYLFHSWYGLDGSKMNGVCFQFCFSLLRYSSFLSQKLHFCLGRGNMKYFQE